MQCRDKEFKGTMWTCESSETPQLFQYDWYTVNLRGYSPLGPEPPAALLRSGGRGRNLHTYCGSEANQQSAPRDLAATFSHRLPTPAEKSKRELYYIILGLCTCNRAFKTWQCMFLSAINLMHYNNFTMIHYNQIQLKQAWIKKKKSIS